MIVLFFQSYLPHYSFQLINKILEELDQSEEISSNLMHIRLNGTTKNSL